MVIGVGLYALLHLPAFKRYFTQGAGKRWRIWAMRKVLAAGNS